MKKLMLVPVLILIFSVFAFCADKTTLDITQVGMGARPIALGAYTGLADDASAVFTNPGGIGLQDRISFVSMSTQILQTVDYQVASVVYPTEYGNFGVGYVNATTPAGMHTYFAADGTTEVDGGSMFYSNSMYILSYGTDISSFVADRFYIDGFNPKVGFGANAKFITEGLSGSIKNAPSASGYSVDLGLLADINDSLRVGATLQNAISSVGWSTNLSENLQQSLKVGASYKLLSNLTLLADADFNQNEQAGLSGGVEWNAVQMLSLRAGFAQREESIDDDTTAVNTNYTLGVGLTLGDFRFDYSYKYDANFTQFSSHYFSICFIGDEPAKQEKAKENTVAKDDTQPKDEPSVVVKDQASNSDQSILDQYTQMIDKDEKVSAAK